jgi:hypothetical protein
LQELGKDSLRPDGGFDTQAQEKRSQRWVICGILAPAGRQEQEFRTEGEKMKINRTVSIVGMLLCLGSVNLAAQTVRIGGESLRANGQLAQGFQYTGPCPVDLQFGWGLISTGPTTVNYRFVRNDGGHSTNAQSVSIPQANRSVPVYEKWRLGANTPQFASYTGWVKLVIESPNPLEGKIGFTIHCQ